MVDGKTKESSSNKLIPRQDTSNCSECQPKADAVILKQKYISGNEQRSQHYCPAPMHINH
jgi:hypothetical protein